MCVAVGALPRGRVLVGLEHSGCPVGIVVSTHTALVSTPMGVWSSWVTCHTDLPSPEESAGTRPAQGSSPHTIQADGLTRRVSDSGVRSLYTLHRLRDPKSLSEPGLYPRVQVPRVQAGKGVLPEDTSCLGRHQSLVRTQERRAR